MCLLFSSSFIISFSFEIKGAGGFTVDTEAMASVLVTENEKPEKSDEALPSVH